MTDETRAELRRGIEGLVRASATIHGGGWPAVNVRVQEYTYADGTPAATQSVEVDGFHPETPPLTPFQTMCLAGLLGDPAQLEAAVVDYCLDQGMDAVTAAYERGKRDGATDIRAGERVIVYGQPGHVTSVDMHPGSRHGDCEISVRLRDSGWPRWMDHT